MLDLRQLQYFVAVAEEEHVGRAAERLHISQSPLSRQIAQLEQRLGLTLFERSQQRIRLTSDGRTFLHEARSLLTHAKRLESLGNRLGRGDEGGLCLGYTEHAMHSGVLSDGLRVLRGDRPQVHIALYKLDSAAQLEGLRQRSLDLALLLDPPAPNDADLLCAQVLDDPVLLALPDSHPLAAKTHLGAADLATLDWIAVRHKNSLADRDEFVAACALAGFAPAIRMEATEPLTALGLVAAGLGACAVQRSLRRQAPPGVTLLELPGLVYRTPLWVAWHRINLRPLVAIMRDTLLALAESATKS